MLIKILIVGSEFEESGEDGCCRQDKLGRQWNEDGRTVCDGDEQTEEFGGDVGKVDACQQEEENVVAVVPPCESISFEPLDGQRRRE